MGITPVRDRLKPEEYVIAVVEGLEYDPTLSFQLKEGFHVLAVVPHYLSDDPESLGYAAVIEWLNPELIRPEHVAGRPTRFLAKGSASRLADSDQSWLAAERAAVNGGRAWL